MSLKARLTDDMKTAMKAGEKDRLGVIRLVLAAIKQKEVDERVEMTDPLVLAVLEKMVKQRKDSITQYESAAREDLAAIERYELGVIQAYLPEMIGGWGPTLLAGGGLLLVWYAVVRYNESTEKFTLL